MAIIKSFSPKQNLSNFQVFINDDKPNSEYFKITEFSDTFTGGKNGFLIDGSECLKETSEVKIEILDVEGNPIYFEPGKGIPDYYEGTSKLVGVYVYEDTPIGTAKITILGELKSYFDDDGNKVDIPNEWKGVYNVKWERTIQVNKNLANENIVRFVKRPKVTITEIVKTIFNKSIPEVTQSGSLEGISLTPTAGTDLSIFSTPTNYKLKITDSSSWTSSIDENNITVRVPTETNLAASVNSTTGSLNYDILQNAGADYVDVNLKIDSNTPYWSGDGYEIWYNSPKTFLLQLITLDTPGGITAAQRFSMEIYDMSSNEMVYQSSQGDTLPSGYISASASQIGSTSAEVIDSYTFTGELGKVYGLKMHAIPTSSYSITPYAEYYLANEEGGSSQKIKSTSYHLAPGNIVSLGGYPNTRTWKVTGPTTAGTNIGTVDNVFPSLQDLNKALNPDVSTTEYVPKIIEVLNDKEVLVDIPFTGSNNLVSDFDSTSYTASFAHTEAQVITESALTGSFAKIDINNLKTFVGDVARVKVFRKSKNAIGDFQFVQESKLESIELLRDIATVADTELSYGEFDLYNLTNYWNTGSNSPITLDNSVLKNSLHIDYIGSGVDTISTEQTLSITEGVEYAINFKTLLSGSFVTSFEDSYIRAYLSGSDYEQNLITASGSAIYKTRQKVSQNILASQTVSDTHLKFDVKGDDWFISNVSLRNAQETSFSPDEFTLIQDIPRKTASETFDFRFEFYDVNNNFIPVNVISTKEFDGGNDFPSSDKLLTFEADRNAFRFSSGSIGNPPFQQIQLKTSTSNLVGSLTFASSAFDASGVFIEPSSYTGTYPGTLTNPSNAGAIITIENFSGSDDSITVGSIVYTASLDGVEEFETVFRLEDGDNAPQLIVTSNANQFIYEPTTLSPKPSGQSLTVKAQRKNLASLVTPVTVNSGSNKPALTFVDTVNGIDTYTISATEFSSSFASSDFDSVTYEFTGSDVFGNEQSDEITLSKVINFDAVSLVLSNESTSFPAKSTGVILGDLVPSSGSVQMFIGGTQIQHNDGLSVRNRFDITGIAESNVTASVNPPTDKFYSISGFDSNKDSGSLTLDIKYLAGDNLTSQSFEKVVSYTKSKKAVPTVLTKISPSTQTINSSSLGYDSPQTMEVIVQEGGDEYTFDSSNLSGGGDSLAQKFNINSLFVDSGSISNSDNILTFGSLTSSFNSIIGSASLDYVDSEGTYVTGKKVRFDLAVSKIGVDGINGASGSNAKIVSLSSTKYAVVYDGDGVLFPTDQNFNLSGSSQNFTNPEFQFLSASAVLHDFASTSEVTISSSGYPEAGNATLYEVRVRENGGSYEGVFDNIDVFGVQSGSDSFTVFLTNEAHVFSATSESVVTSTLADGSFEARFFRGAEQYNFGTSGKSYSVSATSSSIELIQSTNSNQRKFTPSSVSADSGSATIVVTDNKSGQTFDKQYSFTLSKEGLVGERGVDGDPGGQGDDGLRTAQGMVHYNITSSTAPTGPNTSTDSFNFSTGVMSNMTSGWQMGTPTYESGNSNKYWYATFSSVENSSGAGIATGTNNSFGAVTQAIGFSGLVSFTATDTIGDGTDNLSFGVAGSTLINGDNISTGRIISTNYVTGSGDGYTNTGTEFNLDEGLIASKKINILPNGDANFKGDLTGASGTFSGTVQVGGTSLNSTNTLNANTTAGDVGLGNVDNASSASIQAGTTADNVGLGNVENLDAQNQAETGLIAGTTITGGGITLSSGGNIKGGQTDYNTGTGFFLGYTGSKYKFSIGSSTKNLVWDGTDLNISGSIFAESGTFSGAVNGATINVPTTSPKFTVNSAGQMTATDADLSGTISSTSGDIGGWGIATSRIFSPTSGQERMQLTGGSAPNLTVLDSSGSPNVVINSGTALSDLGGGSTSVAGSNITSQTTDNVSGVSPSSNTLTISQDWLAGPTTGLYVSSVPVGTYTVLPTVTVPGGFSNALSGLTVSTIDAGNSYTFNSLTHHAKAVVYISTSQTPYTTKAQMEAGAVWSGYKSFNNTQFGGNFGTEFYLPSNQASSGTSTHQINVVGTWSNTAVATYYIHTALMDFTSTVTYTGTIDLSLETDLKTPLLASSGMTISGTVSRTEMSGGGFQVVSTTSNFVKMQRYSSSQASSVVMLDVGGSIEATGNITANASDKRLKDIKGLITNPLSKLKQLNGVVFNWNEIANKYANHDMEKDHVGLIAQDVQKVLPEVVTTSAIGKNEGKEYLTIWYDKLIPLLVESIKELSEKVEKLEEKIKN